MPLFTIVILALIQGITEFLPISSSGHLVLAESLLPSGETAQWDAHLGINVAVHIGTLFSVLLYFRKDVYQMIFGLKSLVKRDWTDSGARLNIYILIGSIPVIITGLLIHLWEPSWLLAVQTIAWTTLIFGILLWLVDAKAGTTKTLKDMTIKDSLLIGLSQALALIPGTSRSGITMTAARALGYSRPESAHFSLLLAIIAIAGAGTLGIVHLYNSGEMRLGIDMALAATFAFISGYAAIAVMMKWLERSTFAIFAIYRILLGLTLLGILYIPALI